MRDWMAMAGGVLGCVAAAGTAAAQDAPPAAEVLSAEAPAAPVWRVFSESDASLYLIDMSSIREESDATRVRVARVSRRSPAGDYSHVVDQFGVRCGPGETRVETSTDIAEDGQTAETYPADEPWTGTPPGSFDEAVREIACGVMEPGRAPFATIRAYIDAGRP